MFFDGDSQSLPPLLRNCKPNQGDFAGGTMCQCWVLWPFPLLLANINYQLKREIQGASKKKQELAKNITQRSQQLNYSVFYRTRCLHWRQRKADKNEL